MADDLAGREDGRRELGAIDHHVEATFEQADQVLAGIALHAVGFLIGALELLFGDVAVIALELLLGAQLDAEVGNLALAALTVLAGAIFALVDRAIWDDPRCFRQDGGQFYTSMPCASTLSMSFNLLHQLPHFARNRTNSAYDTECGHRFTGVQGQLRRRAYGRSSADKVKFGSTAYLTASLMARAMTNQKLPIFKA